MSIQSRINPLIAAVQKALAKLRPVIDGLGNIDDNQSLIIATVRDYALELLFSPPIFEESAQ